MASKKESQLTTQSDFSSGDLVTGLRAGTNVNFSFDGLFNALSGLTNLNQIGNTFGAPVLEQPQAGVNNFRNIESGSGISATISAENGISIKLNISQDSIGTAIIDDVSASVPVLSSFVAGQGISLSKSGNAITVSNTVDPATGLSNRVVVTQASDLAGILDSTKEYFIDGIINMAAQQISVPAGGLTLTGYNFDVSKLTSSVENYTMFISPAGGSGNVIGRDYAVEVTGASSQVYDITGATGFEAFEFARVNYNDCESLGTITSYRQGLESGTGRFGGKPELTLAGTWIGGYFIDTSIVRSLDDGAYSLFAAGAGFVMGSRFRTNQNVDLPASASYLDFAPANFTNPSTLQLTEMIMTRGGIADSTDSNYTPNVSAGDLVSDWTDNNGLPNTFEGGSIGVTTEATTTISSAGVFVDIAASLWTTADLQHFDSPADGQLRHLGNTPREFKITADFLLDSSSGDDLTLRVTKWDDSASAFVTVLDQTREVNNFQGGRDLAFFNININTTLDQNDYIKLQVANVAATNDVTAETDSYYIVEAR
jgi:hypothetical protein